MNYKRIYKELIDRGKARTLVGYKETHHILPRCLGGGDDKENLVELTAREHFIAHQLLYKIYPGHKGIIFAVFSMNNFGKVEYSRNYEWIRKRLSESRTIHFDREKLQEDILSMNIKDVALKYGVRSALISRRVKEYGLIKPDNIVDRTNIKKRGFDIDISWLKEELQNKSISEIAKDSGYHPELIRSRVRDNNLDNPNHNKRVNKPVYKQKEPDIDLIWLQEELQTKSMPQISEENNFDYEWLRYRVNKYKLDTPVKRGSLKDLNLDDVCKGMVNVNNKTTEATTQISKSEFDSSTRYVSCAKDTVRVKLKGSERWFTITRSEFIKNRDMYITSTQNRVMVVDINVNNCKPFYVDKNIYENSNNLIHINNNAKHIWIYNSNNTIMFKTYGNFKQTCLDNSLPHAALAKSYRNVDFVKKGDYRGWYARKINI